MDIDFKELTKDENFINRIQQFDDVTEKIKDILKLVKNPELYDNLSNSDKIKYNLLMSFSLNSLFWMYLRAEGIDPSKHQIKMENDRLRQSMARAKQISDRKTMPRLNRPAAQRFVRSSLWDPNNLRNNEINEESQEGDITAENWESGT